MQFWGNHPDWQAMSDLEKAAMMAMMEADNRGGSPDPTSARNALGAMINRSDRARQPLGQHVSQKIYQPTIEPSQFSRIDSLMENPLHDDLINFAERRMAGQEPDPVDGATHFLAHPDIMLALEAKNPRKYRSWRNWTGFDPETGQYANQTVADRSHAFLAPEGKWSASFETAAPIPEMNPMFHDVGPDFEPEPPRNPSLVLDLPEGVEGALDGNLMPVRNPNWAAGKNLLADPSAIGYEPIPDWLRKTIDGVEMPEGYEKYVPDAPAAPPTQEPQPTMIAMPERRQQTAVAPRQQTGGRTESNPWGSLQNWPSTDQDMAGQPEREVLPIGAPERNSAVPSFYDDTIKPTLLNALSNIKLGGMTQSSPNWFKPTFHWPGTF